MFVFLSWALIRRNAKKRPAAEGWKSKRLALTEDPLNARSKKEKRTKKKEASAWLFRELLEAH